MPQREMYASQRIAEEIIPKEMLHIINSGQPVLSPESARQVKAAVLSTEQNRLSVSWGPLDQAEFIVREYGDPLGEDFDSLELLVEMHVLASTIFEKGYTEMYIPHERTTTFGWRLNPNQPPSREMRWPA